MEQSFKAYTISVVGQDLFTVEVLDERPVGFSVCVPELAIYTFGKTEEQALRRLFTHVLEKYEDLLNSPIPLNENEQEFLKLYRTRIIPALVEQNIRRTPTRPSFWQRLRRILQGNYEWRAVFLESLNASLKPSAA
nr:hypothetical protein [Anaerolineae bacterium]